MNGTYLKSVILVPKNSKTYYPIPELKEETNFDKVFELDYGKKNIIIDSRLISEILIAFLEHGDDILVYDVHTNTVEVASDFMSSARVFNVPSNLLHTSSGDKLIYLYLFINNIISGVPWSLTKAMKLLDKTTLVDLLLNYIGIQEVESIQENEEKQNEYIQLIKNVCDSKFRFETKTRISDIKTLYSALLNLTKRNWLIKTF